MKKAVLIFSVIFVFALAGVAKADTLDCATHPLQCQGNGSPEIIVNVWGTTNAQIPHTAPGHTITYSNGVVSTCPIWFSTYCVDISNTQYFVDRWGR